MERFLYDGVIEEDGRYLVIVGGAVREGWPTQNLAVERYLALSCGTIATPGAE